MIRPRTTTMRIRNFHQAITPVNSCVNQFCSVEGTRDTMEAKISIEMPLPLYTYTGEDPEDDPNNGNQNPNTAVSENIASISMNVYPNPTSDYRKIASESENVSYTLYTIAGEKLLSGTGKEVNMTNLESGMYVLKAYAGGALQSVKVMKR